MKITSIKSCFYIFFPVLILIASCQKEIDPTDPDLIPDEVKDSTLLIKSISHKMFDEAGVPYEDSVTEYYSYDTLNKKIILTWLDNSGEFPVGTSTELNYNDKGLLAHIDYKYSSGYTPTADDRSAADLIYDADKVLQKITYKLYGGKTGVTMFSKTMLTSGGYQLNWSEPFFVFQGSDSAKVHAIFEADGRYVVSSYSYSTSSTQIINTDTVVYNADGSVTKIISNHIDTSSHIDETYTTCEFISRSSKGDELYNQRQLVLKGIANIPFLGYELFGSNGGFAGILSFFPGDVESLEYTRHPFQSAKILDWQTKQYVNVSGISEFDNKDRLTKFSGFTADFEPIPTEWKITYFK